MDEKCICQKCGKSGAQPYPLVTIRTMTVRNASGTQKYHAMGDELSIDLCGTCIDDWITQRSAAQPQLRRAVRLPLLLLLVSVAVHFLGLAVLIRWVLCALFSGFSIAVAVSEYQRIQKETADIAAGKGHFTRNHMIEELAASLLPDKHEDAALSYLLRSRVLDENQHPALVREYGVGRKKLASIRNYLEAESSDQTAAAQTGEVKICPAEFAEAGIAAVVKIDRSLQRR